MAITAELDTPELGTALTMAQQVMPEAATPLQAGARVPSMAPADSTAVIPAADSTVEASAAAAVGSTAVVAADSTAVVAAADSTAAVAVATAVVDTGKSLH
jgi:hypothetical protein